MAKKDFEELKIRIIQANIDMIRTSGQIVGKDEDQLGDDTPSGELPVDPF